MLRPLQEIDAEPAATRARALADRFSLPLNDRNWRGNPGDYAGIGVGSSLDFQDHRNYLPGDDPRHINWQAFARTGDYTLKLYREEVRPESIFWTQTRHPDKLRPPREDGQLEPEENVYCYVVNQTDTSFSRSPLVADGLMDAIGAYGEHHPWLRSKKAIVGYCGGHVSEEKLTSNQAGATIRSRDGMVEDIFEERQQTGEGQTSGGFLDTARDNVLLPD